MELSRQNVRKICKIAAFIILFYVGLQNLPALAFTFRFVYGLVSPFIIGAAIAFILNVPMRAIERGLFGRTKRYRETGKKSRLARPLSLVITLVLVIGIIFLVMFIIIPEVARTIGVVAAQAEPFFEQVKVWLMNLFDSYPEIEQKISEITLDWDKLVSTALDFAKNGVGNILNSTVSVASTIVNGVVNFVLAFIFALYILLQKEKLGRQIKQIFYSLLKEDKVDKIIGIGRLSESTFSKFLSGQCLEAVILGTMFVITMTIFRFPYAVMTGVLIAFTALIPIFGAFIGCFIGAFLILIVNPVQAFWFVILFIILQQLEGNLIYPYVVGNSVGLPSIWVLVAVTLGGNLMGIAGMLLFIPMFSVLYTIIRGFVYKRLKERNIGREKWKDGAGGSHGAGSDGQTEPKPVPAVRKDRRTGKEERGVLTRVERKENKENKTGNRQTGK